MLGSFSLPKKAILAREHGTRKLVTAFMYCLAEKCLSSCVLLNHQVLVLLHIITLGTPMYMV